MTAPSSIAVAALAFQVTSAGEMQIFPAGPFRALDGRPYSCAAWQMSAAIAAAVARRLAQRVNPLVVDYEHQTLYAEYNGQPAPAAGWWGGALEWREGVGVFAVGVTWTARAAAAIDAGEYRYVSPVFSYIPETGEVLEVYHVAVTNNPAVDGMQELALKAAARFIPNHQQETLLKPELLAQLTAALGLAVGATDEQVIAAATALKTQHTTLTTENGQVKAEIAALKSAAPDPAKFVPVTVVAELQTQVAALTAQQTASQVDALIEQARQSGKLVNDALTKHARDTGNGAGGVAALRSLLDALPVIDALKGGSQTNGLPPAGAPGGADESQRLAALAVQYQADQAKLGIDVDIAAAVMHVSRAPAK